MLAVEAALQKAEVFGRLYPEGVERENSRGAGKGKLDSW